jgi:uncharacterized protein YceH (UPF0502 family)
VPAVALTREQLRLLGCLMEKARTTPADYPLTSNALMRAANQTTSRDPIVDYPQSLVESTAATLKDLGLVRFVHSPSNRAMKYRHVVDEVWGLDRREEALLTLLFLRGPQTPGELRSRAERLADLGDVESVRDALRCLADRPEPMVSELERVAGHKENRWVHLLGDTSTESPSIASAPSGSTVPPAFDAPSVLPAVHADSRGLGVEDARDDDRLARLEREVGELRVLVDELRSELGLAVGGTE